MRVSARSGRGGGAPRLSGVSLTAGDLRWTCPPIEPSGKPVTAAFLLAQDRPMRALRTGLSIFAPGYHLFVSGLVGSGRTWVVQKLLQDIQPTCRRGPDRVLVHNVREPNRPLLVSLRPGTAPQFRDEVEELFGAAQIALQSALRARPHRMSRRVVIRAGDARERRIMDALQRQAQKLGCALVRFQSQSGAATADIYPIVDGEPITLDALSALVLEGKVGAMQRDVLLRARGQLLERLEEVSDRVREDLHRTNRELREMDRKLAWKVLQSHFKQFRTRWDQVEVADWLDAVGEFLERHLSVLIGRGDRDKEPDDEVDAADPLLPLQQFQVHIVKMTISESCPVVVEHNPTAANLFGTIVPPQPGHQPLPGHVLPGALLRADGGYLIVRAAEVVAEPAVWQQLKRTLQTGRLEIREVDLAGGGALQPEAIPVDLKIVLIGEPGHYEQLAAEDPQFGQIFKIHAEFDGTIPRSRANLARYADYLQWVAGSERLRTATASAAAVVAEYGARAAGRRDRLITRYSELSDLLREADYLAEQAGSRVVDAEHVRAAIAARHHRHDLTQEQTERDYSTGYMRLSTSGRAVGQINALTVLDTGALAFGRPCRITCNSGVAVASRSGLINIEGHVKLSGPIHDKGIMILEGYLLQQFGSDGPLCMQATICFEQLYNGVEGDSASLAQLLSLLSSLSGIALDQALAITGSVNQKAEVQAVSGVNEKIEGFFRLCRARRLNGAQGVVMPRANVQDLMLDQEVVDAVAAGRFHVHAVESIEQAIELLAGMPAKSVLEAVAMRLHRFRELARG